MVFLLPHLNQHLMSGLCVCVSDRRISGNGSLVAAPCWKHVNRSLAEVPLPSHTSFSFLFSHTCSLSLMLPEENERWLHIPVRSFTSLSPLPLSPLDWLSSPNTQLFSFFPLSTGFISQSLYLGRIFRNCHVTCRWLIRQLNLTVRVSVSDKPSDLWISYSDWTSWIIFHRLNST